jgi:hypothetical protein
MDEEREIERQNCKEINDRKRGDHKAEAPFYRVGICRVQGADPETQDIFNSKDDDRNQVNDEKFPHEHDVNPDYRFKNNDGYVQENEKDHEIVKIAGESINFRWRFQYLVYFLFQRGNRGDGHTSGG